MESFLTFWIHGWMPVQLLAVLVSTFLIFVITNHYLKGIGKGVSPFLQAVLVWLIAFWIFKYLIYPPLPSSLLVQYMALVTIVIFLLISTPEYGENVALIQDWGNVIQNPRDGLFGAIIIGPKGTQYRDPVTGEDISLKNSWQAHVILDKTIPGNEIRSNYRDFTLFFQDEDEHRGTSFMPYAQQLAGLTGISYGASDPLDSALENDCPPGELFICVMKQGRVSTPVLKAHAGDPVLIHVLSGFSEQVGIFSLEGHEWAIDQYSGAHLHNALEFGGSSYIRVDLRDGAGGPYQIPGDYIYMNHLAPYMDAGQWGIFQVLPKEGKSIQTLNPSDALETQPVLTRSR